MTEQTENYIKQKKKIKGHEYNVKSDFSISNNVSRDVIFNKKEDDFINQTLGELLNILG